MQSPQVERAPIDPQLLEPALAAGPDGSRTLPATAYTSAEVLAWEFRWFFEAGWVCLGRARDLAAPGDQRSYRIGNEGILVVRGADGELRGFYNTCRHRGHELLEPGARRTLRVIRCPYHAWVYRLDGTLAATPRFGYVCGFDKVDHPLVGAPIGSWHGWVFANAGGEAPPPQEAIGSLGDLVTPWAPERLFVGATHTHDVRANWKTITEHHLGTSHGTVGTVCLFPNLLVGLHLDHVIAHRVEPIEPGRTRIESQWLFPPEARTKETWSPPDAVAAEHVANRAVWRACESVHEDLTRAGGRPGLRSADEVRAFVTTVARGYLEGHAPRPPEVESTPTDPVR